MRGVNAKGFYLHVYLTELSFLSLFTRFYLDEC